MRLKRIQYNTIVGVLDCFYTSEETWIFNPTFLKPYRVKLDNLSQQIYYYRMDFEGLWLDIIFQYHLPSARCDRANSYFTFTVYLPLGKKLDINE